MRTKKRIIVNFFQSFLHSNRHRVKKGFFFNCSFDKNKKKNYIANLDPDHEQSKYVKNMSEYVKICQKYVGICQKK